MLVALCSANNSQEHETYTVTLEDLVLKSAVRFLNEVEESLYFERSAIDTDAQIIPIFPHSLESQLAFFLEDHNTNILFSCP